MRKLIFLLLACGFVLVNSFERNVFAYDNHGYPYNINSGCTVTCNVDSWGFCKNNCTSYAAHMLNEVYGVDDFNNNYKNVPWSHGRTWNDAARSIGIPVDRNPLPGDIAYWDTLSDYGHVAFVEKVHFDGNGNATGIDITQYNIKACSFSQEINISPTNPSGFIHILAYNEGITGTHYLDCYDMGNICDYQTHEEWGWILQRVDQYRCKNCSGQYESYVNAFFDSIGGMGGGSNDGIGGISSSNPPSASKPDLFIKTLEFTDGKTQKYDDEDIKITVKTKNSGSDVSSAITGIKVKLYRFQGENPDNDVIKDWAEYMKGENLEHDDTKTEYFEHGAPDVSSDESLKLQYYAKVDTSDLVAEANENNNSLGNISCRIHKRPNLKMTNLTLDGGRVDFIKGENPYGEGTLTNTGGEPFEDIKMKFYLDNVFIGEGNMRHYNLEHNETKRESVYVFTAGLSLGAHIFRACTDFSKDQDQADNCRELVFNVRDPDPPPPRPPTAPMGLRVQ